MHFGEILQRLRNEKGLSQADLAERAGVSVRTVHGWERGARSPVSPAFLGVLRALGVGAESFAELTDGRKGVKAKSRSKKPGKS